VVASVLALIPRDIRTIRNSDAGIRPAGDEPPPGDEIAAALETYQPPVPYLPG